MPPQPRRPWIVPVVAIAAITIMETFALSRGVNGVMLSASLIAVAGIGGYHLSGVIHPPKGRRREVK